MRADARGEDARHARACRTSAATCRSRTRRSTSTSTATRVAALGLTAQQVETRSTTPTARARSRTIYAPNNQYQVILRGRAGVPGEPERRSSMLYVRSAAGQLVPLSSLATITHGRRAARRQPHGPAAVGHDLVQPEAGRRARRRGRGGQTGSRAQTLPVDDRDELPGHGAGVPELRCRASASLLVMAIVVIYIVLGILYESFTHPLTILSGLPFAGLRRAADAAASSRPSSDSTPSSASSCSSASSRRTAS